MTNPPESDTRRQRAEKLLAEYRHNYHNPNESPVPINPMESFEVNAMLAHADEEVAKERARCAKVCLDQVEQTCFIAAKSMCCRLAKAIERGEK
jgi:hypothetical protein